MYCLVLCSGVVETVTVFVVAVSVYDCCILNELYVSEVRVWAVAFCVRIP